MITSIATMITSAIAALTLVLALIQYWKKNKTDHSIQVLKMLDTTRKDDNIVEFIRYVDYLEHTGWYNEQFHKDKKLETLVDNALHYYEYILYLKQNCMLTTNEFQFFEYDINRIVGNRDVQNYFFNLFHFTEPNQLSFKYKRLLDYGFEKKKINKDEFNKKGSKSFKHVLPF